ncbi:MAG: hypothetical protein QNJ92_05510 [Alphaproteobacteria bacterium]|nr:hypothetical protein [Alphaproteobacteria bacterium]
MKTSLKSLLLFCCATVVAGGGAVAQVNPFDVEGGIQIKKGDLTALTLAAQKLYDAKAPVGTVDEWENPKSGNRGTVTLIDHFERDGGPCMRLGYTFIIKGEADPKNFALRQCLADDGKWKILD